MDSVIIYLENKWFEFWFHVGYLCDSATPTKCFKHLYCAFITSNYLGIISFMTSMPLIIALSCTNGFMGLARQRIRKFFRGVVKTNLRGLGYGC